MNFWDHLFDAECEGLDDFASMWIVTIIVLPGILIGLMFVYFMIPINSQSEPRQRTSEHSGGEVNVLNTV